MLGVSTYRWTPHGRKLWVSGHRGRRGHQWIGAYGTWNAPAWAAGSVSVRDHVLESECYRRPSASDAGSMLDQ